MFLKDALSLAVHRGSGRVSYRDGRAEASADIREIAKDGAYFRHGDALVPLHRITRVEVEGRTVWLKGVGAVTGP